MCGSHTRSSPTAWRPSGVSVFHLSRSAMDGLPPQDALRHNSVHRLEWEGSKTWSQCWSRERRPGREPATGAVTGAPAASALTAPRATSPIRSLPTGIPCARFAAIASCGASTRTTHRIWMTTPGSDLAALAPVGRASTDTARPSFSSVLTDRRLPFWHDGDHYVPARDPT